MIQTILVFLIFAAAIFYVGRLIYKNFTARNSCASGCGKCAIDFSKIEKELQNKGA